ncbi:hypothetical protein V9T40_001160 [Parthenolecanium corni]|uniref:Uncharacterized protein n=1 Tax=Parthenolecanium corni TaxID=536013 RepID=A0AAN9TRV2_9HEMI
MHWKTARYTLNIDKAEAQNGQNKWDDKSHHGRNNPPRGDSSIRHRISWELEKSLPRFGGGLPVPALYFEALLRTSRDNIYPAGDETMRNAAYEWKNAAVPIAIDKHEAFFIRFLQSKVTRDSQNGEEKRRQKWFPISRRDLDFSRWQIEICAQIWSVPVPLDDIFSKF